MFAEAVNQRIPSFVIQHGLTNRYWWPCVAGKLLLWGSAFHRELLGMGAPPSRLAICGMPASDHLFMRFQREGKEFTPRPVKSCVILSDTQSQATHPLLYLKFKDLLKATVSSTPFIKWSVKLHPIEDDVFYKDFMGCHNFAVLPKTTTLEQAVMGADAACTLWSTSGLEAMMMKRPLFVLDVEPVIREFAWWPKFGGGFFASNAGALIGLLEKASADESFTVQALRKQDEFLRQNFANAGGAADAALDLIQEIVGTNFKNQSDRDVLMPQTALRNC
ncbi:MAG TPA: hypothetical protein VFB72_19470 [Verrucomicrobiae bacterium]|nr:hypothetical protein [Verrucomicrobiae bacterium]